MRRNLRNRFWIECTLAFVSGILLVLTLFWHNWIEVLFGVEPDGGDGSFERALVVALIGVMVTFSVLARTEWQRAGTQPQST